MFDKGGFEQGAQGRNLFSTGPKHLTPAGGGGSVSHKNCCTQLEFVRASPLWKSNRGRSPLPMLDPLMAPGGASHLAPRCGVEGDLRHGGRLSVGLHRQQLRPQQTVDHEVLVSARFAWRTTHCETRSVKISHKTEQLEFDKSPCPMFLATMMLSAFVLTQMCAVLQGLAQEALSPSKVPQAFCTWSKLTSTSRVVALRPPAPPPAKQIMRSPLTHIRVMQCQRDNPPAKPTAQRQLKQ